MNIVAAGRSADEITTYSDLRSLVQRSPASYALSYTISFVRKQPGIRKAFLNNEGPRTQDGENLALWLYSQPIQTWLRSISYRKHTEAQGELLQKAADCLVEDQEALRAAWALHQASGTCDRLPPSARQLSALLFALAADHGPRVPLCHRAAVLGIEMMTGKRYRSLATITNARVSLAEAGVLDATLGQSWQAGRKSKPTVYDLLPLSIREQLKTLSPPDLNYALIRGKGHSSVGLDAELDVDAIRDEYPHLTRAQRDTIESYFTELRLRRLNQSEAEARDRAEPLPDLSHLIDDFIGGGIRDGEAAEVG